MIKSTEITKLELGSLFVPADCAEAVKTKVWERDIEFADNGLVEFEDAIAAWLAFSNIDDLRVARTIADEYYDV